MDPQSEKKQKRTHKDSGGSDAGKKHHHKEKKHKKEHKEKHHKKHGASAAAAGAAGAGAAPQAAGPSRPAGGGSPSNRPTKRGASSPPPSPVSSLTMSDDSSGGQAAGAEGQAAASRQQPQQQGVGGRELLWEDEAAPEEGTWEAEQLGAVATQEEGGQGKEGEGEEREQEEGEEEGEDTPQPWRRPVYTPAYNPYREYSPAPYDPSSGSSSEGEGEGGDGGVEVMEELPDLSGVAAGREELWLVRLPPKVRLNKLAGAVLRCPAEGPLTTDAPPLGAPGSVPQTAVAAAILASGRGLGSVATSALEAAAEKEAAEQGPQLDKAADAFTPTGDMPLAGSRQYGDYQQLVANEAGQPAGHCVDPPRAPRGEVELGRLLTAPAKKLRHRTWRAWRVLQEMPTTDTQLLVVGDTGGGVPVVMEPDPKPVPAPLQLVEEEGDPMELGSPGGSLSSSPAASLDSSQQKGSHGVGGGQGASPGPSNQGEEEEEVEEQPWEGMGQLVGLAPTRLVTLAADMEVINSRLPGLVWKVCEPVAATQGWPLVTPPDTTTGEERCQQLLPGLGASRTAPDGLGLPLLDGDQQLVGVSLGGYSSDEETEEEERDGQQQQQGVKHRRLKPLARPLQRGAGEEPDGHQVQVAEGFYHSVRLRRWEAARRRFVKQHGMQQQQQGPGDRRGSGSRVRKAEDKGPSWDPLWQLRQDWDEAAQGPGGAPDWMLDGALYPQQAPDTNTAEEWAPHYAAAEAAFAGKQGARTTERQRKAAARAAALDERAAAAEADGQEDIDYDPAKTEASPAGNGYAQPTDALLWGARGAPQDAPAAAAAAAAGGGSAPHQAGGEAGGSSAAPCDLGPGLAGLMEVEVALGQEDWLALAEGPAGEGPGASCLDAAEEEHAVGKLATPWYPAGSGDVLDGQQRAALELPEEVVTRAADLPKGATRSVRRQLADLLTAAGLAVARDDSARSHQQQQEGGAAPGATAAAAAAAADPVQNGTQGSPASHSSSSSSRSWWAPASHEEWQAKLREPREPAADATIEELDAMLMAWGQTLQERLADEAVGLKGHYDHVPDLPLLPPRIWQSNMAPRMGHFLSTSSLLPEDMKQGPLEEDGYWWRRFVAWLQPHAFFQEGQLVAMVTQERMQRHLDKDEDAAAAARQAAGGGHEDANRDRPLYVPDDITPDAWAGLVGAVAAQDVPAHTLVVLQGPQGPGQHELLAAAVEQEAAIAMTLEVAEPDTDHVGVMQELIPVPQRWRLGRSCLQPDPEYLAYCNAAGNPLVRQKARDCLLAVDTPAAAAPALYLRPDVVREKRGDGPVLVLSGTERLYAYQDQGRFDWADAPTWEEHEEANVAHELGVDWEEGEEEEEEQEGGVQELVVGDVSSGEESD